MEREHRDFQILKTIEAESSVSQRKLASQMDLSVASVNIALKRLVKKGFITMIGVNPRRIKYYITTDGLREKTQLAYMFFWQNIHYYKEVRNDIEARIIKATAGKEISIAIYGLCEFSEITYMVVSRMRWDFLGFYLEKSRIINNRNIMGYNVQSIELLKSDKCLLLLTDKCPENVLIDMTRKNVGILNLVDYSLY